MEVKLAQISGVVVEDLNTTFGYVKKDETRDEIEQIKENIDNNIDENVEIKSLSTIKNKSIILDYIERFFKRTIDIIGGLFGVLLLIPLTIFVAILNFINKDKGPIFYCQDRIGKNGKHFKMFKYRTMVTNADEKLNKLLEEDEEARQEWYENRKLKNDPRITKIGKILRKTSLDEFPQFINVLLGEMSIVGPRAVVDDEIEKFGIYKKDVLSVKPGITGYWAANGRSNTSYQERVFMEHKYIREFSVWMDIKILFKTVESVIKKEGAV